MSLAGENTRQGGDHKDTNHFKSVHKPWCFVKGEPPHTPHFSEKGDLGKLKNLGRHAGNRHLDAIYTLLWRGLPSTQFGAC